MQKKPLIVANWKMNLTKNEVKIYLEELLKESKSLNANIVLAPSFTLLDFVNSKIKNSSIKLSAQNMFFADFGAFTGEVSASMLKDIGAEYVILGHSERRQYFLEMDTFINKKIITALKYNLKPIICVGETLEEKENNESEEVVKSQILNALKHIEKEDLKNIVIAYEPIWAIGTGKSANSEEAENMAKYIESTLQKEFDIQIKIPILYGGSVNENNIGEFLQKEHIAGALVGGASLLANTFLKLIKHAITFNA